MSAERQATVTTAFDLVLERIIDPLTAAYPGTPVVVALRNALGRGAWAIPVVEGGAQVGSVSVPSLESLAAEQGAMCVREVLEPPLPEVDERALLSEVEALLAEYPAVVVTRGGFPLGLLTSEDLVRRGR
jgi:predicted transcriptional regulator